MQTLELVTFRTTEIEPERFVAANAEVNDWLRRQPGFVARHLAARDDGSWVDVVLWTDREVATQAATKLMEEIGKCEAMAAIDPQSIAMSHAAIRMSSH